MPKLGQCRAAVALAWVLAACQDEPPVVPADYGSARPPQVYSGQPLDRLAPGELAPGKGDAFGLVLPRRLRVDGKFAREVHASGRVAPEDLANYIRKRVTVKHVELGTARTVFPQARINTGNPGHVYRIEVVAGRAGTTRLVVRDITRPAAPQGLSEEERWRRAGLGPDGRPLDLEKLQ
jgi:hypothetical protein